MAFLVQPFSVQLNNTVIRLIAGTLTRSLLQNSAYLRSRPNSLLKTTRSHTANIDKGFKGVWSGQHLYSPYLIVYILRFSIINL
jgi:hypothetical protein